MAYTLTTIKTQCEDDKWAKEGYIEFWCRSDLKGQMQESKLFSDAGRTKRRHTNMREQHQGG